MIRLLEKLRLFWWARAYNIIWSGLCLKDSNIVSSTRNDDDSYRLASFIAGRVPLDRYRTILDIGCGNGRLSERIFKSFDLLVQTDYSSGALKFIENPKSSVRKYIIQSEVMHLPFKGNTFDFILLYSVIHYAGSLSNAKNLISSAINLLKDGGRLYIGDVPIKKKLNKKIWHRLITARSIKDIKYFFAEFMQISFLIDDFINFEGVSELRIISEPDYLKFHESRVDIEIIK